MKNLSKLIQTQITVCLVAMLSLSVGQAAAAAPQQASIQPAQAVPTQQQSAPSRQINSERISGTVHTTATTSDALVASSQNAGQNGTPGASESNSQSQQNGATKPVGTAAAPYEKTSGVAASRPAGAAIAPAKQRRVRSFLIKFGVVVGAGVALGTVAALSHASPSRPH